MKQFVHALNYGSEDYALHKKLQVMNARMNGKFIELDTVKFITRRMKEMFPKATTMMEKYGERGKKIDYDKDEPMSTYPSALGHSRFIHHLRVKRRGNIARNAPIQATAADMFVEFLIQLQRLSREEQIEWKLIMPMHDGFPFLIKEEQKLEYKYKVNEAVEVAKERIHMRYGYADVNFPMKVEMWDESKNPIFKILNKPIGYELVEF